MQAMSRSYRSLSLIWNMHGDTVVMAVISTVALALGGAVWSVLPHAF